MARTVITPISQTSKYPTAFTAVTWTAADPTNGNRFVLTGRETLLVRNVGATTNVTFFSSTSEPQNRSGDITNSSLATNGHATLGPLALNGWRQEDGYAWVTGQTANIEFAVLRQP